MSGRIIPPRPAAHRCEGRPPADSYPAGTRWKCNDCDAQAIVVEGSHHNEPYRAWRDAGSAPIPGEYRGPKGDDR